MLTKASISYPPKEEEAHKIIPNHCTRLDKCTYCPIIKKIDNVTCKITGKNYTTIDLPKHISCELSDRVYLSTSTKCDKYYVGETGRMFRSRIYEHKLSANKPKDSRITPVFQHFTGKGHSVRICLFGVLRRFQHCTGHITTGSWKGRGNQYIEFARVVYCKLPTNGKQLPAFPLTAMTGIDPRPQRWEARVLPLCHRGPSFC